MERRRVRRKKVNIKAEIIGSDSSYTGLIENVSEKGIYLDVDSSGPLKTTTHFIPGTKFEVIFQLPSGEKFKLYCQVKWSFKTAPHGLTRKIGMEVIFPPPSYVEYCNTPEGNTVQEQ